MLSKEANLGFQFYYLIRTLLFSNKYEFYIDMIKTTLGYNNHKTLFIALDVLISSNDRLKFINNKTKYLIQQFISEMLHHYKGKNEYKSLNSLANKVKIGLNCAQIYTEEEYLINELNVKFSEQIPCEKINLYEQLLRVSIDNDFIYFNKITTEEVKIDHNALLAYILTINTYLNDISDIQNDIIFNRNVMDILNYGCSLKRKVAKNNNIPHYRFVEIKKQAKKTLKRIKGGIK